MKKIDLPPEEQARLWRNAAIELNLLLEKIGVADKVSRGDLGLFRIRTLGLISQRLQILANDGADLWPMEPPRT